MVPLAAHMRRVYENTYALKKDLSEVKFRSAFGLKPRRATGNLIEGASRGLTTSILG